MAGSRQEKGPDNDHTPPTSEQQRLLGLQLLAPPLLVREMGQSPSQRTTGRMGGASHPFSLRMFHFFETQVLAFCWGGALFASFLRQVRISKLDFSSTRMVKVNKS